MRPETGIDFFRGLSAPDARLYLARFLGVQGCDAARIARSSLPDELRRRRPTDAILPYFKWTSERVGTVGAGSPSGRPAPLADAPAPSVREFDDASRVLVLRAAFFLGQCFVSEFRTLRWDLGRAGRAEFQQPVVSGLRGGADLPPLMLAEDLLRTSDAGRLRDRVERAVRVWRASV